MSQKRGVEGIIEKGVLANFKGISVHDCWGPYWMFEMNHAVCCVHILRELNGIIENNPKHTWTKSLKDLLLNMLKTKKDAINSGLDRLNEEKLKEYSEEYEFIFRIANNECPPPPEVVEKNEDEKQKEKKALLLRD